MLDVIRENLGAAVPFVGHVGVRLLEVGTGTAVAVLDDAPALRNHLGTLHAGVIFALGETASGAAVAGALAPVLFDVRPIARSAQITYLKPAKGTIKATALVPEAETLVGRIASAGRIEVTASVHLHDEAGVEVARLEVDWVVLGRRRDSGA